MKIMLDLTKREAEAVLRRGFRGGDGIVLSQAYQAAEMKVVGALQTAVLAAEHEALMRGLRRDRRTRREECDR